MATPRSKTTKAALKPAASKKPAVPPKAVTTAAPTSRFAVGDRVVHPMFGPGAVAAVNGDKLDITFKKAGRKTIVEHFVKRA